MKEEEKKYNESDLETLKKRFISIVSHEFRTPLTIISASAELLQYYFDSMEIDMPEKIYKNFSRIQTEIKSMSSLMEKIIQSAHAEKDLIPFQPEACNVRDLCNQIILGSFSNFKDQRYVDFEISGFERDWMADPRLLNHILSNLLSNSFKYSDGNPKLILHYGTDHLLFRVIDDGIGIPKAEQSNLFESFFRASNSKGFPGTGLGLVVVKNFVDIHKGHIRIESEENNGTTVDVKFPA